MNTIMKHMNTQIGSTATVLVLSVAVIATFGSAVPTYAQTHFDLENEKEKKEAVEQSGFGGGTNCSLEGQAGAGDVFVDFRPQGDDALLLATNQNYYETDIESVSIPTGSYKIHYVSYDDHTEDGQENQTQEIWKLRLRSADGTPLVNTGVTQDVANKPVQYREGVISNNFQVPSGVAKINARHGVAGESNVTNSVYPVCVLFEKIGGPTPAPTCSLNAGPNDTLIDFSTFPETPGFGEKILANQGFNNARRGPVLFDIDPGQYKVTLESFDDHCDAHGNNCDGQGQSKERWQLQFRFPTLPSPVIAATQPIVDLPGGQNSITQMVETNFTIPATPLGPINIEAFHAFYDAVPGPESIIPVCALLEPVDTPPEPAKLTLIKDVINNDGGNAEPKHFNLFIDTNGPTSFEFPKQVVSGETTELRPGTYSIYEENIDGYVSLGWSGKGCENIDDNTGKVELSAGEHVVCTITNDDVPVDGPIITIFKTVINDNGGTAKEDDFSFFLTPTDGRKMPDIEVFHGIPRQVPAGSYRAYEIMPDGSHVYTASDWGGDCAANGDVSLQNGDNKACTITNDDVSSRTPTITLVKRVENNHGGTNTVEDFQLFLDPQGIIATTSNRIFVKSGVAQPVSPGTYQAGEIQLEGYTASDWMLDCDVDGFVTIAPGEHKRCRIVNSDIPVTSKETNVFLNKSVTPSGGVVGTVFTYTLTYGNDSDEIARNVSIDDFPAPSRSVVSDYVIVDQPEHGECFLTLPQSKANSLISTAVFTCALDDLEPDEGGTITYTGVGIAPGTVDNVATIYTTSPEDTSDNVGHAQVTVTDENSKSTDIGILKEVTPDSGKQFDVFTYTLTYENFGPLQAVNVKIEDRFQEAGILTNVKIIEQPKHSGVDPDDDACVVYEKNDEDMGIDCDLGTLVEGDKGTIVYEADAKVKEAELDNIVVITTTSHEENTSNNQDDAHISISDGGGNGGCTSGCGGGPKGPDVFLFGDPQVLGTSISLASVPYTGVGSTLAAIAFVLGLVVLTGGGTYFFIKRKKAASHAMASGSVQAAQGAPEPRILNEVVHEPMLDSVVETPQAAATGGNSAETATLEKVAAEHQTLISAEGAHTILQSENNDEARAVKTLTEIIEKAKGRYATEDGWLLLNQTRIADLLFSSELSATPLFVQWVVDGNRDKAFSFLRTVMSQGQTADAFLRKVVYELDRAYQARLEGSDADPAVIDIVSTLTNKDLEALITGLVRAVDGGYTTGMTGAKVALTRMFEERARAFGGNPVSVGASQSQNTHKRTS